MTMSASTYRHGFSSRTKPPYTVPNVSVSRPMTRSQLRFTLRPPVARLPGPAVASTVWTWPCPVRGVLSHVYGRPSTPSTQAFVHTSVNSTNDGRKSRIPNAARRGARLTTSPEASSSRGPRKSSVAIGVRSMPLPQVRSPAARAMISAQPSRAGDRHVVHEQEHRRLDLLREREVGRAPDGGAVLAPRLLVATGPAVALAPETAERRDALLGVDRGDVEPHPLAGEDEPEREVGVLGDGVLVPAAEGPHRAGAHRAVGAAVRRQVVERLAAVLVDEVAAVVVDRDRLGEARLLGVAHDATALDRADVGIGEVADEPAQDVGARLVVGVEHDDHLAGRVRERGVQRARLPTAGVTAVDGCTWRRGSRRASSSRISGVRSSEPSSITMSSRRSSG